MKKILFIALLLIIGVTAFSQGVRLMSYNVRNGRGMDNKRDIERIKNVIIAQNPDVVAIQELDSCTARSENIDVLKAIASGTPYWHYYSGSIPFKGGKYGIGIMSKEKALNVYRLPLPGTEEKRSLLMVEFDKYAMCCTHLSLTEADREKSISIILDFLNTIDIKKPVFMAGDFNAKKDSKFMIELKKQFKILSNVDKPTFPATTPKYAIDYIVVAKKGKGKKVKASNYEVVNEPIASDHRPIILTATW